MKQKLTHNTLLMSLAGRIKQEQLKIGTGTGSSVGVYFDIGSTNKPGIRYTKTAGWEYSTDGTTWLSIGGGGAGLTFEPVEFTAAHLTNGVLTIAHNLNNQYPLGVGYSVEPKQITYKDVNTLEFDYSDQGESFTGGAIWFIGSKQSMLPTVPEEPEVPDTTTFKGILLHTEDPAFRDADECSCCSNSCFFGYWAPFGDKIGATGTDREWTRYIRCEGEDPSYIQWDAPSNRWIVYDGCCTVPFMATDAIEGTPGSPWEYTFYRVNSGDINSIDKNTVATVYSSYFETDDVAFVVYGEGNNPGANWKPGIWRGNCKYASTEGYYVPTGKLVNGKQQYTNGLYYLQYIASAGSGTYGWVLSIDPNLTESTTDISNTPGWHYVSAGNSSDTPNVPTTDSSSIQWKESQSISDGYADNLYVLTPQEALV